MARHANIQWNLPDKVTDWTQVNTAVLMDIRDELQRLNLWLHCANFVEIPRTLKGIRRKLPTPQKK